MHCLAGDAVTDQATIAGRTGHMLNYEHKERIALRELVIAAQNAQRQQRLKERPRDVSPTFLLVLEANALRRVS